MNIAISEDYVYNFCNRPLNRFHRYCREWYDYNQSLRENSSAELTFENILFDELLLFDRGLLN